jgi:hypothetical protein
MQIGDQSYVLGLFNTANKDSNGIISMDLTSLTAAGQAANAAATPVKRVAPTPPWNFSETPTQADANVQTALAGQPIVNEGAAQLDLPGASVDYKKLFALYKALDTLSNIAAQAAGGNSPEQARQLSKAFDSGLAEVSDYVGSADFSKLRLADGATAASAKATLTTSKPATTYTTPPLANSLTTDVPAFAGSAQFNISIKRNLQSFNIPIDLSNIDPQARSLANVIGYINQQLAAAGVETRVASNKTPGQPQTITTGGHTVTLPPTSDQYGLQIKIGTSEAVTFTASQTAGAVYVAQTVGDPNPDGKTTTADSHAREQLAKFQTDTVNVATPPQLPNQPNFTPGRVYANNLEPNIGTVHATQVAPDGSVYMLADVTGTTYGQTIQGTQDVALVKYDSAGRLVYSRTLGASDSASGLGLAVSADGQVAISGSVTGNLYGAVAGALNSGPTGAFADETDSFVTLYDASGNEVWTERRGSAQQDQASQVAFSADGKTVYVAGQAQGAMPAGGAPIGGYDGYIEAFTTDTKGAPHAAFTQSFGTTGQDSVKGMVVDGNTMITASVENGHAILRNFDISSGTPSQTSTRDLGDLQGGTITGLALNGGQLVVAGNTANGALAAGTVTRAASGGTDAFAAQVSEDLSNGPGDAIAYYGGSGDDRSTALAVSGGQVWIAGQAGTDLPGQPAVGTKDGFLAQLDIATGAIVTSQRFTGRDGMATPTAIAVDTSGSSILDRLGLPKGAIGLDTSQQLTAQSSLRAGEQFTVSSGDGPPTKITIDPGETLDTLALKIQRASGFQALATVTTVAGVKSLSIKPANATQTVTLGAGPTGKNALTTLGLPEGLLSQTTTANGVTGPADGGPNIYGLGLSSTLNIDSAAQISHARAVVGAAMGVVRKAYQDLVNAATPPTPGAPANGKTGTVPAYLTAQLANLQAGLARLTGGGATSGNPFNINTTA